MVLQTFTSSAAYELLYCCNWNSSHISIVQIFTLCVICCKRGKSHFNELVMLCMNNKIPAYINDNKTVKF